MSDFNVEHFGKRLAACRDAINMTQADFAHMLGCTNGALSLYERGKRQPPLEVLFEFCSQFGFSTDYLLCCATPSTTSFSERLLQRQQATGKLLSDLLEGLGYNKSAADAFLKGACFPNSKLFRYICGYYGCTADYLFGRTDSLTTPSDSPISIPIAASTRYSFDDLFGPYHDEAISYLNYLRHKQDTETQASNKEA